MQATCCYDSLSLPFCFSPTLPVPFCLTVLSRSVSFNLLMVFCPMIVQLVPFPLFLHSLISFIFLNFSTISSFACNRPVNVTHCLSFSIFLQSNQRFSKALQALQSFKIPQSRSISPFNHRSTQTLDQAALCGWSQESNSQTRPSTFLLLTDGR